MGSSESQFTDDARTPQQENRIGVSKLDPRSPSQNVKRTPMKLVAPSDDPRSPTQNVLRTPIQRSSAKTGDNLECDVRQVLKYDNEQCEVSRQREPHERMPLMERNKI